VRIIRGAIANFLWYLHAMDLSRRHFFRRLWSTGERTPEERALRYLELESFSRMQLLPYDFTLTDEQLAAMQEGVRFHLKATRDKELFAEDICVKLQKIVDAMMEPWRQEHFLKLEAEARRAEQNREAALGYVSIFLTEKATPAHLAALRSRYGVQDLKAIESRLETELRSWANGQTNEELLQCDTESIKNLVFAQILSWC